MRSTRENTMPGPSATLGILWVLLVCVSLSGRVVSAAAAPGRPARMPGSSALRVAQAGVETPLVINEVLASNATSPADPQNDYDDWIELYDAGGTPVDVAGMYVTDGAGFERSTGYEPYFHLDLGDLMYGRNASYYIRIPFTVSLENPHDVASLLLKVRYDDGFVAWLNGQEVQRVALQGAPAWNARALSNHNDDEAVNFETFDISASIDKLERGPNLLALQGLNAGASSSDFLISVELPALAAAEPALPSGVSPGALRYTGPLTLDARACRKARTLTGNTWSALQEAVFAVGPVAENLRISEIMYHPADTGDANDPNTESIELTNKGIP